MKLLNKIALYALALIFFASGAAKLAGLEFEIAAFENWGYPLWFMYLVGVIEVSGALLLLLPRLSGLAAGGLALFMTGAVGTHIIHGEWAMLVIATTIMALSARHAWQSLGDAQAVTYRFLEQQ
jgi:putative oxidoreductase